MKTEHPLWPLQEKMLVLLEKGGLPTFIRLKILQVLPADPLHSCPNLIYHQALIWLSYAEDTESLERTINASLTNLPVDLFNRPLLSLQPRPSSHPAHSSPTHKCLLCPLSPAQSKPILPGPVY